MTLYSFSNHIQYPINTIYWQDDETILDLRKGFYYIIPQFSLAFSFWQPALWKRVSGLSLTTHPHFRVEQPHNQWSWDLRTLSCPLCRRDWMYCRICTSVLRKRESDHITHVSRSKDDVAFWHHFARVSSTLSQYSVPSPNVSMFQRCQTLNQCQIHKTDKAQTRKATRMYSCMVCLTGVFAIRAFVKCATFARALSTSIDSLIWESWFVSTYHWLIMWWQTLALTVFRAEVNRSLINDRISETCNCSFSGGKSATFNSRIACCQGVSWQIISEWMYAHQNMSRTVAFVRLSCWWKNKHFCIEGNSFLPEISTDWIWCPDWIQIPWGTRT
jgi:hypothetical protein